MNKVQMAAKLYECRDAAKGFYKEEYGTKIIEYTNILKLVMIKYNLDEIPALLKISQSKTYQECGITQMLFMAAVVELIEPSKNN